MLRNEALEAAIRADRSNPDVYEVYADWLQTHDSVLGELIALQSSAQEMTSSRQRRIAAIMKSFGLPVAGNAHFESRFGLWSWLHVGRQAGVMDATEDIAGLARHLFSLPMCAVLEELRIGILKYGSDVPTVLREATANAWAHDLVSLRIGDVSPDIRASQVEPGDIAPVVSKGFPKLQRLRLRLGDDRGALRLGALSHPRLEELVIDADSLPQAIAQDLPKAELPALETLTVGTITKKVVAQLLNKVSRFPRLRVLRVVSEPAFAPILATIRAALAPRIEVVIDAPVR